MKRRRRTRRGRGKETIKKVCECLFPLPPQIKKVQCADTVDFHLSLKLPGAWYRSFPGAHHLHSQPQSSLLFLWVPPSLTAFSRSPEKGEQRRQMSRVQKWRCKQQSCHQYALDVKTPQVPRSASEFTQSQTPISLCAHCCSPAQVQGRKHSSLLRTCLQFLLPPSLSVTQGLCLSLIRTWCGATTNINLKWL